MRVRGTLSLLVLLLLTGCSDGTPAADPPGGSSGAPPSTEAPADAPAVVVPGGYAGILGGSPGDDVFTVAGDDAPSQFFSGCQSVALPGADPTTAGSVLVSLTDATVLGVYPPAGATTAEGLAAGATAAQVEDTYATAGLNWTYSGLNSDWVASVPAADDPGLALAFVFPGPEGTQPTGDTPSTELRAGIQDFAAGFELCSDTPLAGLDGRTFSPTGADVYCYIADTGGGTARCDVLPGAWAAAPPRPDDCRIGMWGDSVVVDADGARLACVLDQMATGETVPDGGTVTEGTVRCDVTADAVECTDSGSGAGFRATATELTVLQ